MIVGLFLVF